MELITQGPRISNITCTCSRNFSWATIIRVDKLAISMLATCCLHTFAALLSIIHLVMHKTHWASENSNLQKRSSVELLLSNKIYYTNSYFYAKQNLRAFSNIIAGCIAFSISGNNAPSSIFTCWLTHRCKVSRIYIIM